MVFCRNCGAPLESGTRFCTSCGSLIPDEDISKSSAEAQNVQQSYSPPVDQQPTQYYYSAPPQAPPKKKKHGVLIAIIAIVVVIGIVAAVGFVVIGIMDTELRPTVEYDSGFTEVTCEKVDGYYIYTPVMKEGYIFDYWVLPDGSRCTEKILTMTGGTGTIKGYSTFGYTVTVYTMYGIGISGNGDYRTYETAVLEASDENNNFAGWYSTDGTLLSNLKKYTVPTTTNITIIAKSDSTRYDGTSTLSADLSGTSIDPTTSVWYVMDGNVLAFSYNKVSSINQSINPGKYTIIVNGKDSAGVSETKTIEKEITGTYTLKYSWEFKGNDYNITWTVPYETYKASKDQDVSRSPTSESDMRAYATAALPDNMITDYLKNNSLSMNDEERANFVLKFVQLCTWYQYDSDYNGRNEYWKFPLETLVDQRGDCEDTSILYCNLMRTLGYDSALILYLGEYYESGHAAAGVCISKTIPAGFYYLIDSEKYYYCETTSDTMIVGEPWKDYTDLPDHSQKVTVPKLQ